MTEEEKRQLMQELLDGLDPKKLTNDEWTQLFNRAAAVFKQFA